MEKWTAICVSIAVLAIAVTVTLLGLSYQKTNRAAFKNGYEKINTYGTNYSWKRIEF